MLNKVFTLMNSIKMLLKVYCVHVYHVVMHACSNEYKPMHSNIVQIIYSEMQDDKTLKRFDVCRFSFRYISYRIIFE